MISKAKDSAGFAYALGSIGYEYSNIGNFVEALKADSAAFNMYRSIGPKAPDWGIALCEFLFGVYYEKVGDSLDQKGKKLESLNNYRLALDNYLSSRNYFKKTKNSRIEDIESGNSQVGRMLIKLDRFSEANKYFQDNLALFKIYPFKEELKNYHQGLASVDSAEGNYKDALAHYDKYISYRDSLNNEKSTKKTMQASLQYEFDKKQLAAKADQDKKDEEQKRIKNQQYFIIAGLALIVLSVLVVALIQFRNNRQKKKANIALEKTLSNLKATQAQLIQQEKMASLVELTAGIAHEIQNPLNFVNNFSEVNKEMIDELQAELKSGNTEEAIAISNDIKENEEKINHHGKRADAIVKGMLQHSRTSTGVKEPTDINTVANEYLRLAYHGLRAKDKSFNVELKTDFDNSIGRINIIRQDIGRVLLNLYNNAFYAVNEKNKSADELFEPTVIVSTKKTDNKIAISVKDNGNGIPQKVVDKIFQPFFTTKPTGQGTGLGLSLSYDIVKAHGGEIKVETKEREGTEFIVNLPF